MRVRCTAVRYFTEPQPGMVEAYLADSSGFRWQIVEKSVIFHEWDWIDRVTLPIDVSLDCCISSDSGGPTVTIYLPDVGDRLYEVDRTALIETDSGWTAPTKGKHLFVVLRLDDSITDPLNAITGTKAYRTKDQAEAEADRLNALNADKGARYFVRTVRLQADPTG